MIKEGTKLWFIIIGIIVLVGVLGFIGKIILFPVNVANKAINTTSEVVDKTLDSSNVIFNYENFHNIYQGAIQQANNIINTEKSIETLKQTYGNNPIEWPKDVRSELSHQQQTLQGYQAQYQRIKSDYNADSQKLNRNLFKSKSLPYMLPDDYKLID